MCIDLRSIATASHGPRVMKRATPAQSSLPLLAVGGEAFASAGLFLRFLRPADEKWAAKVTLVPRLIPAAQKQASGQQKWAAGSKKPLEWLPSTSTTTPWGLHTHSKKRLLPLMNNSWDKVCSNQAARCPLIRRRCSFGPLPAGSKINPST